MFMTVKPKILKLCFVAICLFFTGQAFGESDWIDVISFARKIKAEVFYEAITKTITFSKDGLTATTIAESPILVFNASRIEFCTASKIMQDKVLIPPDTVNKIEKFFYSYNDNEPLFKVAAILIDPGHGGKDPGAIGYYTNDKKKVRIQEKDIVLSVALELVSMLKKTFPDKNILMTRDNDTYPTLEERVEMANSIKLAEDEAIVYISIHANSSFNRKAKGFEVWYLPRDYKRYDLANDKQVSKEIKPIVNSMLEEEFSLESILMAKNILQHLDKTIGNVSPSRGLKEQAWFVVRNTKMPSVLVEVGFVSNEQEAKLLDNKDHLTKCAVGIYNGIVQFISQFENYGF